MKTDKDVQTRRGDTQESIHTYIRTLSGSYSHKGRFSCAIVAVLLCRSMVHSSNNI